VRKGDQGKVDEQTGGTRRSTRDGKSGTPRSPTRRQHVVGQDKSPRTPAKILLHRGTYQIDPGSTPVFASRGKARPGGNTAIDDEEIRRKNQDSFSRAVLRLLISPPRPTHHVSVGHSPLKKEENADVKESQAGQDLVAREPVQGNVQEARLSFLGLPPPTSFAEAP
jgi:hypothetical protein